MSNSNININNKILIVEDEKPISDLIVMNLKVAGYDTITAYDGEEAKNILLDEPMIDLALFDVMLPQIDGFELLEYAVKREIPVIFLTAKNDINSKITGLKGGAEDYIVKPFEPLELLVRIEKILDRQGKLSTQLNFKDITVNTKDRIVCKKGQQVNLKPLEFDILVMLIRNKNRTVTREKLLSELWGTDYIGETRTLDVHMAQVRKKLGLHDNIVTVHKTGYRLEE